MYSNMRTYKQREKYTCIQTHRETHTHHEETYTDTFEVNWDFRDSNFSEENFSLVEKKKAKT